MRHRRWPEPGQVVVTAGVHVLTPGQKVKFYVDPTLPAVPRRPCRRQCA
jgi:hypothetical protein